MNIYSTELHKTAGQNEAIKYLNEKGPLVHLPSCFCYASATLDLEPNDIIKAIAISSLAKEERTTCTEENAISCIHAPDKSGVIRENMCANCPTDTFRKLIEYQSLKAELQDAYQQEQNTKQKLLSHFQFKRQK